MTVIRPTMLHPLRISTRSVSPGLALAVLAAALVACSAPPESTPTPIPSPTVVVASTDLAVGPNRFVFGILDSASKPLRVPEVKATFVYLDTTPPEPGPPAIAKFVRWPGGRAGVYVANVSFDLPGRWGVLVGIVLPDGTDQIGQSGFVVKPQSSSPNIGAVPPSSANRTARDVSDLKEITSSPSPDPDLYQMTIAEALSSGRPGVVTFATPAFCRTATCGPQVEVVVSLKDRHRSEADFIHVEVYENPREMHGDLSKGRISPIMEEWGLQTEPFTFVLGPDGLVHSKFEGFVTEQELEAALTKALEP